MSGPPSWSTRATIEDVHYAYRLILRRPPDPDGLAHYQKLVAKGLSFEDLVHTFVESEEARRHGAADARPTPVDLGGYHVCVQTRDREFAQAILATREYEPHVCHAVREQLGEGDVAVDIGANVGCIALLAARLVGARGLVIAVEPKPDNLRMLYAGVVLNGFENVRVFPFAASSAFKIFSLKGGTSNTHLVEAEEPGQATTYAQAVVLDELLGWLPRLDLVKMDIEGHEPEAFTGFTKLIERHRPALVLEFNPRCLNDLHHQEPIGFLAQVFALYADVRVTSPLGDDVSFKEPGELMDYWHRRNREVTEAGQLSDGMLHFDLVTRRGRS